ncbi:class III extradiol ring-cleavage dioxygenase [Sorangium sp. So ce296]|uniref:dioxygenase family protein n=1 Tax=Sorangium sp. So ce296 TaxID=3133296 RepID=UPI003F643D91
MSETHDKAHAGRMPALFLAHGSPFLLDDRAWVAELRAWAQAMPRPKAILMLSAHWVDAPATLGATETVPLVYDFYNFPEKYYRVTYPAPGAPALARRVRELLGRVGPVAEDPRRGLDHGAYVPLVCMYPDAEIPVLQISLPTLSPAPLLEMGRALAPLRDEGVLLIGSGFLTHNLRAADWRGDAVAQPWATEFDAWCAEVLGRRDVDALLDYRRRAPGVKMALPTHEHFVPVVAALGASIDVSEAAAFPITGLTYGSFTKRSVQFG